MGFQMTSPYSNALIVIKVFSISLESHSQAKLSGNFRLKIWKQIKNGAINVFSFRLKIWKEFKDEALNLFG